jgi:peptide/nickel transport system substrate-binding protein
MRAEVDHGPYDGRREDTGVRRRRFGDAGRLVAALALAATVALTACTKVETKAASSASGNPWTKHGVLRIAGISEPDSLNPVVGNQQIETDLSMFWAGYLFNWNDKDEFVPELATEVPTLENGGISADGKTITYHLRRGVKWHDGAPFGANDVIFTYRAVMNPKNNTPSRTGYDLIESLVKKDDATLVVHLKKPWAPFVASFFTMSSTAYPILPEHLLGKEPDINRVAYNTQPVGTGPFIIDRWERGSKIVFRANSNYWRGKPKLERIEYRTIPDENTILTELRTHEADLEFNAPSSQYPSLSGLEGTTVALTPFTSYNQIAFNLRNPILADVRVRRALAHATDSAALIEKVAHGVGIPADSDQPPFLWAHNDHLKPYAHDPAAARALLDEAGWHVGADGIRVKNGKRLSLTLAGTTGAVTGKAVGILVQSWWREIGVDVQIKYYQSALYFATAGAGGIIQNGKYDIAFFNWINGVDPDDSTQYMCDQFPPAGQNTNYWCNREVDRAEAVALSSNDRATRKKAYDRIQELMLEDEPLIPVWFTRRIDVYNSDLKNYRPAHAVTNFWNSWEWEI